jgi:hypothetical protein
MISSKTLNEVRNLPVLSVQPLQWVMKNEDPPQGQNVLWLEFGVWEGKSVNYISQFTKQTVYGFDSFEGLPEFWRTGFDAGAFNLSGKLPKTNKNVSLVKGWFNDTLPSFLEEHQHEKIGFVHLDADLYSSTKFVLLSIAHSLAKDAIIVFDELINYDGFDGCSGELRAWDEFINEQKVSYSWIGGHGPWGDYQCKNEKAAVRIHGIY